MKKTVLTLITAVLLCSAAGAQTKIKLRNASDSMSYILGSLTAQNIKDDDDIGYLISHDVFVKAFNEVYKGKEPLFSLYEGIDLLRELQRREERKKDGELVARRDNFMRENAKNREVIQLESGTQYKVLRPSDGRSPRIDEKIYINYTITTYDGTEISSSDEGEPEMIILDEDTYDEFLEAFLLMNEGGKYIFWLPELEHWGNDSPIIMEVELVEVAEVASLVTDFPVIVLSDDDTPERMEYAGDYLQSKGRPIDMTLEGLNYPDSWKYGNRYFLFRDYEMVVANDDLEVLQRFGFEMELKDFNAFFYTAKDEDYPEYMIVDAQVDYDYPYGAIVYRIDGDKAVTELGVLNVCEKTYGSDRDQYGDVNSILKLYNLENGLNFTFSANELIYNPKGWEVRFPGYDMRYIYSDGKLTETGAAHELSYFRKRAFTEKLMESYNVEKSHILGGDLNGDGYEDFLFKSPSGNNELIVVLCRNYEIVDTLKFKLDDRITDFGVESDEVGPAGSFWIWEETDDEVELARYRIIDGALTRM